MKPSVKNTHNTLSAFQILNLLGEKHQKPSLGQEVVTYTGSKWIPWGSDQGTHGLFPQRIAETFQNSKTLRAVLTQKSNLVASELTTESEQLQRKIDLLCVPKGQYSLRELIKRVALDIQLHGEGFIKEVRHIEYAGSTPVKERSFAQHVDATNVRMASNVDDDLMPVAVFVSKNWEHYTRKEYRPEEIPIYGNGYNFEENEEGLVVKKTCIHRISDFEPGMQVYGRGNHTSAYWDSVLESILPRWNYTHLMNSIHLSGILNVELPFAPDDDTANELRDKIREQLKGENAFGPSTPVNITGGDGKLSLLQYSLPQEGAFRDLTRTCERNIIMSCGWHPSLMGVAEPGQLGNVREVENHHKRAMEHEIIPLQEKVMETYLKTLYGTDYYELAKNAPIVFHNKPLYTPLDYISENKLDEVIPDSVILEELGLTDDNSQ